LGNTALGQLILAGLILSGGGAYGRYYYLEQGRAEATAIMSARQIEAAKLARAEGFKDGKAACPAPGKAKR